MLLVIVALAGGLPYVAGIYIDPSVAHGGNVTAVRFPFMVQLQQHMVVSFVHHCGGSLLTARHILTAAHCASESPPIRAQVGTVWRGRNAAGQERLVSGFMIHERYVRDGTTRPYDIALATVERPFVVDGVSIATIPLVPREYERPPATEVMGFGKIDTEDTLPDLLRVVECHFHPPSDCGSEPSVGTFCVGHPGATACQGDSGGPVVSRINGVTWLVGLVSYGMSTCGAGPITCTDVSQYEDWIREGIQKSTDD